MSGGESGEEPAPRGGLRLAGLTQRPKMRSSAAVSVSALSRATTVAEIPAAPIACRSSTSKANSPVSAAATVSALNEMVRPARGQVRATATRRRVSRGQLLAVAGHQQQRVVDAQRQAEHRHHADDVGVEADELREAEQHGERARDGGQRGQQRQPGGDQARRRRTA